MVSAQSRPRGVGRGVSASSAAVERLVARPRHAAQAAGARDAGFGDQAGAQPRDPEAGPLGLEEIALRLEQGRAVELRLSMARIGREQCVEVGERALEVVLGPADRGAHQAHAGRRLGFLPPGRQGALRQAEIARVALRRPERDVAPREIEGEIEIVRPVREARLPARAASCSRGSLGDGKRSRTTASSVGR